MTRRTHNSALSKNQNRVIGKSILAKQNSDTNSPDLVEDMSGDNGCEDDGGFNTTDWVDQNIGTDSHFQYMYIAGIEVTYCGQKGHLTVHSRSEHRFDIPARAMTREEITKFAVSCAFQVLSEQYGVFKSEAKKKGYDLEAE